MNLARIVLKVYDSHVERSAGVERSQERGQCAIVTGGAGGLGWAICERLAAAGWRVAAGDLAPALASAELPAGVSGLELDVRERDSIEAAIDRAEAELAPLGLFVNNAGVTARGALVDFPEADWLRLLDINLNGAFRGTQAAGARMLDRGGVIVNVASVAWARGAVGRAAYGVAKAGLVSLTQSAAVEWGRRGVRVNAVAPGYVLTELNREAFASGALDRETVLARVPSGRFGEPEEVGAVVAFLASPAAAYVNGHVLAVDGGFLAEYGVPFEEE
jgi:3-oxoacyl-[acyl-carrier protein] reductase